MDGKKYKNKDKKNIYLTADPEKGVNCENKFLVKNQKIIIMKYWFKVIHTRMKRFTELYSLTLKLRNKRLHRVNKFGNNIAFYFAIN